MADNRSSEQEFDGIGMSCASEDCLDYSSRILWKVAQHPDVTARLVEQLLKKFGAKSRSQQNESSTAV